MNVLTGWLEVPKTAQEIAVEEGPLSAWTVGLLHGVGRAVQRTGVGMYDMVTFMFPGPSHYEPALEPEYVF